MPELTHVLAMVSAVYISVLVLDLGARQSSPKLHVFKPRSCLELPLSCYRYWS